MENNFKCKDCGNSFFVSKYRIKTTTLEVIYLNKEDNQLICPECAGQNLYPIEKEGEFNVMFGKFNSLSLNEKREALQKRANAHANSKQEIEKRKNLDKETTKQLKDNFLK